MKIKLIKEYAFGVKAKPVGTVAEVTNGLGESLIKEGIAEQITETDLNEVVKKLVEKKKNNKNNNVILQNNEVGEDASDKNN